MGSSAARCVSGFKKVLPTTFRDLEAGIASLWFSVLLGDNALDGLATRRVIWRLGV